MAETCPHQPTLFQAAARPQPAAAAGRPVASPAPTALAVWQPWLVAIRQERQIAQELAPALTARLLTAYIDRYVLTKEAPSRAALESALGAQRPGLIRHLSAWMRRRPSPTLQDALWCVVTVRTVSL